MHTNFTLSLSEDWDLALASSGDILTSAGDAATVQNVACECRRHQGDCFYDADDGVAYFSEHLGEKPNAATLSYSLTKAARRVGDVAAVKSVDIYSFDAESREVTGEITILTKEGNEYSVAI